MTKLMYESKYGKYLFEIPYEDLTIDEFFSQLIEPMLLAVGYSQVSINEYLDRDPIGS
jgi:hypothetical protein